MTANVKSAQTAGLDAQIVSVESDISRGIHSFTIIGLPDKAIEESKERVSSAIKHSGFKSPKGSNKKIVVSLAPADIKKEGPLFDLPIALSYLLVAKEIEFDVKDKVFIGELSLNGSLYPVKGILPLVEHAKKKGFKEVFIPKGNAKEGALVHGIKIYAVETLKDIINHFSEENNIPLSPVSPTNIEVPVYDDFSVIFEDIKGQGNAKRGLIISAAGGHNIAFYGPPGTGKTLLARSLISILPPLTNREITEVTSLYSIAGLLQDGKIILEPPFRAPHHTSSYTAVVGGGTTPSPGEISFAHKGVLFLDEFPEFDRRVIESLREPLEEKRIRIARAKSAVVFPADCIVVIAMNPSRSGSDEDIRIDARSEALYRKKISGPIVDRIDMWLRVDAVDCDSLSERRKEGEYKESQKAREQVMQARETQRKRFEKETDVTKNADLSARNIDDYVTLTPSVREILNKASTKLGLSPRSYHRLIKLSRTIADIEGSENVKEEHIYEALQYKKQAF
ncbi:MAG: YifB family Mg chelatase-like AAA ATPase [Candidatus Campbellbacteria bacterium]|nr:YifB family Mg chelatase-like AAA ATPase [Candidatus Campbellbacteria bacterium]